MFFHGALAHHQFLRDLLIRLSLRDQGGHFALARRQRIQLLSGLLGCYRFERQILCVLHCLLKGGSAPCRLRCLVLLLGQAGAGARQIMFVLHARGCPHGYNTLPANGESGGE